MTGESVPFPSPLLADSEMLRTLRLLHEDHARILRAELTMLVGVEPVQVDVQDVQQVPYEKAVSVGADRLRVVVPVPPLDGDSLWLLPVDLIRSFSDVLQGGDGQPPPGGELTEVDTRLAKKLLQILTQSWRQAWRTVLEIQPRPPEQISTGPLYVDVAAPQDPTLRVTLTLHSSTWPPKNAGSIVLCLPAASLSDYRDSFNRRVIRRNVARGPVAPLLSLGDLGDLPVELEFTLDCRPLAAIRLLRLSEGDEVDLRDRPDAGWCSVRGRAAFRCRFGTRTRDPAGKTVLVATGFEHLPTRRRAMMDNPPNAALAAVLPVELTAVLGRAQRTLREILEITPDAEIELDRGVSDPVVVLANGTPLFEGSVQISGDRYVVRVQRVIRDLAASSPADADHAG